MKRTIKYVALDVHQATAVAPVRDDSGRVIARYRPGDGQSIDRQVAARYERGDSHSL